MKWMPRGWSIVSTRNEEGDWNWVARATGIPEMCSPRAYRRERDCHRDARRALRRYALKHVDNCWTPQRVHACLPGEPAFCGARGGDDGPFCGRNAYSEPCGRCDAIISALEREFGDEEAEDA